MMRDNSKSNGVSNSSSTAANALNLNGVKAIIIRKNSPESLILHRLRQNLLYSKLRSLVPRQTFQGATEVKVEPHEIPGKDSEEENHDAPPASSSGAPRRNVMQTKGEEDKDCMDNNNGDDEDYELEMEVDEDSESFVPSIKIKRMDGSLLISTIVLKDVALTSELFCVLEEEKLDIVYENQYRTETKVAHTIQVKVQPDYDVDELEKKLCKWAGKPM